MGPKKLGVALSIAIIVLVAAVTRAGDDPLPKNENPAPKKEDVIRDRAISKLAAWRADSAETILDKDAKYDKSQPWLTADALLLATTGVGSDEETLKKGLDLLTAQAKNAPEDPVAEYFRGVVLAWMNQRDMATAAWKSSKQRAEALVKKDPKDARAQYYLGASLVRLQQPAEARKVLKKIDGEAFDPAMVEFQIGLTYLLEDNWDAAKNSFNRVAELDPRFAHLYFYRGLAWDKLGEKARFINDLDQFVKLAPNSPEARTAKAILSSAN
jgi:tetratricopeptide (TPR) repeat protein